MASPRKLRKELADMWPAHGLVQLRSASNGTDGFEFFVSNPPTPGVQPVLGVRRQEVERDYDAVADLPKRLRMAAKAQRLPQKLGQALLIDGLELLFWDAVIVLPKVFPTAEVVESGRHLLSAFSIVAAVHREFIVTVGKRIASRQSMRRYYERESVFVEPYIPRGQMGVATGLGRRVNAKTPAQVRRALKCLRDWRLWFLRCEDAIHHDKWQDEWRILERWTRWTNLELTWPERAKELEEFRRWGDDASEELQGICERLGLPLKNADISASAASPK